MQVLFTTIIFTIIILTIFYFHKNYEKLDNIKTKLLNYSLKFLNMMEQLLQVLYMLIKNLNDTANVRKYEYKYTNKYERIYNSFSSEKYIQN